MKEETSANFIYTCICIHVYMYMHSYVCASLSLSLSIFLFLSFMQKLMNNVVKIGCTYNGLHTTKFHITVLYLLGIISTYPNYFAYLKSFADILILNGMTNSSWIYSYLYYKVYYYKRKKYIRIFLFLIFSSRI